MPDPDVTSCENCDGPTPAGQRFCSAKCRAEDCEDQDLIARIRALPPIEPPPGMYERIKAAWMAESERRRRTSKEM